MSDLIKRIDINFRKIRTYSYYVLGMILKKTKTHRAVKNIVYFPSVNNIFMLKDLANRISWYYPSSEFADPQVSITVERELLNTDLKKLSSPMNQYNYIKNTETKIKLVVKEKLDFSIYDAIMIWDKKSIFDPLILKNLNKVYVVDPNYYFSVEGDTHRRMYNNCLDKTQLKNINELSKNNYKDLLDSVKVFNKGYVFGTGPSIDQAMKFDYSDGFRIICNSIVKNEKLLKHIKPHLLVFGDPQYHFGPSLYSQQFRQNVITALKKFNFYIMTQEYSVPIYLAHFPKIKNRIIGMPAPGVWEMSLHEICEMLIQNAKRIPWFEKIPGHDKSFNFPTVNDFYVRLTGSVLPSFMVPVVSAVCDEVYIIGADGHDYKGRKPDEKFNWSYSPNCQFVNLMDSAFCTHPSYFKDRPFLEDFNIYNENFKDLIDYGESIGKKYYSLTPSHIPALNDRTTIKNK